jgi:hypothetical protein
MTAPVPLLALLILAPAPNTSAQLLAAKDGPIVYGHHHLNVTNADEEILKFPNPLMFLRV